MIYLSAIILAVVEGVTEFLPISSTGHLVLVEAVLSLSDDNSFNTAFMVVIQLPAILSVVLYFRHDLWPIDEAGSHRAAYTLWGKVGLAFLPAAILGLLVGDLLQSYLFRPLPIALALAVGGVILILIEKRRHREDIDSLATLSWRAALFIGCFQCLALVPGTSRSGATIIGGLLLGASRQVAAQFSFFLAIPTMLGATVYTLARSGLNFTHGQWGVVALGSLVSFLVAYAVIGFFMTYIRRHDFAIFGYYRIVLAIAVFVVLSFGSGGIE